MIFFLALCMLDPSETAAFQSWLQAESQWIRVGLQQPSRSPRLVAQGPLLVLDGMVPIDLIEPGGNFYIARPKPGTPEHAPGWLLQLLSTTNEAALETARREISAKHPDLTLVIRKAEKTFGLCVGTYPNREAAQQAIGPLEELGFKNLFPVQAELPAEFLTWVDANLDKHLLRARNLALVRLDPNQPIEYGNRAYRGILRFRSEDGQIRVINELPLETYLRGVVPSELGPFLYPELEAQKAQAVAARTYALRNLNRFRAKGYDICDTPACQAYDGTKNEHQLSDQAVAETRGQVLLLDGKLADALYTSTSGGATEDVGEIFKNRSDPHLKGRVQQLEFPSLLLPSKPVPYPDRPESQDLSIRMQLLGLGQPPPLEGPFTGSDFTLFFKGLAATFGAVRELGPEPMSKAELWRELAALPALAEVRRYQIRDQDANRYLELAELSLEERALGAFLFRLDLLQPTDLSGFKSGPISRQEGFSLLVRLAERLCEKTHWQKAPVKALEAEQLRLDQPLSGRESLELAAFSAYITQFEGRWVYLKQPRLEAFDFVYLPLAPEGCSLLRLETRGEVASLDRFSSNQSWFEVRERTELEQSARKAVSGLSGLKDVRILRRSASGRVVEIELVAESGTHKVTGFQVRVALGIKETLFDWFPSYRDGRLSSAAFLGRGWGHGVGMSQTGAYAMAELGKDYRTILQHYYQGVEIGILDREIPFRFLSNEHEAQRKGPN